MSRTFSTKNGSVDSLKLFCRCQLRPKQFEQPVRHRRAHLGGLRKQARALHCVAATGLVCKARLINSATASSSRLRGRPGRNSSCNPCRRWLTNRRRHLPTVASANFSRFAIALLAINRPPRAARSLPGAPALQADCASVPTLAVAPALPYSTPIRSSVGRFSFEDSSREEYLERHAIIMLTICETRH